MKATTFILCVISIIVGTPDAFARQYVTARGQVVHTRRAPVVVHRVLPPFRGQHVYGK